MHTKNANISIKYICIINWRYREVISDIRNMLHFNNEVLAARFGSEHIFKEAARLQWQIDLSPPDSSFLN